MPFPYTLPFVLGTKAAVLTDDFTTLDTTTKWDTNGTVSVSSGRLNLTYAGSGGGAISPKRLYDLTNSAVSVRLVDAGTQSAGEQRSANLVAWKSDFTRNVSFVPYNNVLTLRYYNGSTNDNVDITYDPVAHAYLRIRETAGITYWDTSPDGATWTNRRSLTTPFDVSSVSLQIVADLWGTGTASVTKWDDFNCCPLASTLTDDFTTQDTAKWTFSSGSTVTGGVLSMTASNFADSTLSDATYDWTGSSLLVKVTPPGTAGVNDYLIVHARIDGSNRMGCTINNSQIFIERFIAGVKVTSSPKTTYNATNHAWIQLRESGGTMFLDVSATGAAGSWTEIDSLSTSTLDLTNNVVFLQAANASGVGTATFDHVNLSVPPASSLTDDFTTNTGQWTLSTGATISGGKLNITADTNYNNAYTTAKYDFTESSVFAEIGSIAGLGLNDETNLALRPVGSDLINGFGVVINNGCVFLIRKVANVGTGSGSFPAYDATAHRWLRIRESGGIGYLDASPTGIAGSWTQIDSMAYTMDLTSVAVSAMAGKSSGSGTATFDNVNIPGVAATNAGQFFVMF